MSESAIVDGLASMLKISTCKITKNSYVNFVLAELKRDNPRLHSLVVKKLKDVK